MVPKPNLRRFLSEGPGLQLEFLPEPTPDRIAETLVAFANTAGGTVVLGVDPEGAVGDLLLDEEVAGALRAALSLCLPPVVTRWHQEETPAGPVVMLWVPRSNEVHRLIDGRVVIRAGRENRTLKMAEEDRLEGRFVGELELQPVPGTSFEDLDGDVIEEYLEKRQRRSPRSAPLPTPKLLRQIGALTPDGTPTVSGLLLFGREPQLYLPHSRAIFVKFDHVQPRGPEGTLGHGRREEIVGPLARIIERAWRVTWEEMDKAAVVKGLEREEALEYPEQAVREALVNAVAHRDYRLTGRSIEIRMYTDRLEILSPGGLPAHITLDNIVDEHYSRNPRIVNGLFQWGYIEELGLGVDRMIEEMVQAGHPPPEFDATPDRFVVRLYNRRDPARVVPRWEQNMNERQIKAMEYVQRHGAITNREYRTLCPHVSPETLRLDLADLVQKGLLIKVGSKRGTRYILK